MDTDIPISAFEGEWLEFLTNNFGEVHFTNQEYSSSHQWEQRIHKMAPDRCDQ